MKIGLILTLHALFITFLARGSTTENNTKRLIITETAKFNSLDPLDGDKTQNLPVVRMIYLTPVQITNNNELTSYALDSFSYDEKNKTIQWKVKKGLKFSDGSELTATDVAFAVARMAYKRPKFPVIENIEGLDRWLNTVMPLKSLPSGVVVDRDKVKIKFMKSLNRPLFRFCLELFSIIPKQCVSLETNKIICEKIPTSGFYKVVSETESEVEFNRSHLESGHFDGPEKITFEYLANDVLKKKIANMDELTVLSGNEAIFDIELLKKIKSEMKVQYLPAARFTDLDINKSGEFFKHKLCRQIFVKIFRDSFQVVAGTYFNMESSIFTKIVPGYLSNEELNKKSFSLIKEADVLKCKGRMKLHPPLWAVVKPDENSFLNKALQMTFKKMGGKDSPSFILDSREELEKLFIEGKVAINYGGSGFWAQDAAGDIQMLFTPGLHKSLNFVSEDKTLQFLIHSLKENPTDKDKFLDLNQFLHDEALFNVYSHVRRFFAYIWLHNTPIHFHL